MIGALVYLQVQSIKNRLRVRLRRLKKPKYLVGAVVGVAYFYFFFFRNLFTGRRGAAAGVIDTTPPEALLMFELLGALALFAMVLSAWIFPHERAALAFTEAEIAFLFPAPVTRRTLIHFKLVRSQIAILFTTLLLTFGPVLALMLLHYWWVVRSDVAFEEASVELSRKLAERIAAIRAGGDWHSTAGKQKKKRPPFALRPAGIPAVAFLWKNLIS